MFRTLGKQCVAILVVGIDRKLQLQPGLSSIGCDGNACASGTSFALVVALSFSLY